MSVVVKGLSGARNALRDAMKDVNTESEEMVVVILQGISAATMPYVPVDTGALINSETRRTTMTTQGPIGFIEYGGQGTNARGTPVQDYARFIHDGPQKNWQKPGASNLFLAKGTEDFVRDDLSRVIAAFQR